MMEAMLNREQIELAVLKGLATAASKGQDLVDPKLVQAVAEHIMAEVDPKLEVRPAPGIFPDPEVM